MMKSGDYEQEVLRALNEAVSEALERKRRLGQYAVVWRDDGPALIGPDVPPELQEYWRPSSEDVPGTAPSSTEE